MPLNSTFLHRLLISEVAPMLLLPLYYLRSTLWILVLLCQTKCSLLLGCFGQTNSYCWELRVFHTCSFRVKWHANVWMKLFYAIFFFFFSPILIFSVLFIQITAWKEYVQVITIYSLWLKRISGGLAAYGAWLPIHLLDIQQQWICLLELEGKKKAYWQFFLCC